MAGLEEDLNLNIRPALAAVAEVERALASAGVDGGNRLAAGLGDGARDGAAKIETGLAVGGRQGATKVENDLTQAITQGSSQASEKLEAEIAEGGRQGAAKLENELEQAGKRAGDKLGEGVTSTAGTKIGTGFDGIAKKAAGVLAAVGVADFAKDSVAAFSASEQSSLALADAIGKFPALAGTSASAFDALATSLATKTRFDDDATKGAAAQFAQFGLNEAQIKQLIPLTQDFAARTGTDLTQASEQVAQSLLGQGRALKQVGIDFVDAGSLGANFDQVVGGLRTQVGGFAQKEGKSAAGSAAILANTFGELQESVGAALIPIFQALLPAIQPLIPILGGVLTQIVTALAPIIIFVATALGQILEVVGPLIPAILAIAAAAKLWTAIQLALNFALSANPIGLIVIAIAALITGIILAYKNSETFRGVIALVVEAFKTFWGWIKNVAEKVGEFIAIGLKVLKVVLDPILNVFKSIGEFIAKVVGGIKDFGEKLGKIKLPDWLIPGSPSPLENTLVGISGALKEIKGLPLPRLDMTAPSRAARPIAPVAARPPVTQNIVVNGAGFDPETTARLVGSRVALQATR